MLGLMIRDLMVQRKRLWIGVLYCIIGPFIFKGMGQGALVAVTVAVEYMILLTAFAYDDKYKVDPTLASLPIARTPLVIVRYLEVPILTAATMLFYMLVTAIGRPWMSGMFPTNWLFPAAALLAASLMSSVYMPIIYRFGYVKARMLNMVIFMICIFVPSFVLSAVSGPRPDIQVPAWLANASHGTIAIIMVLAAVLFLCISCMVSVKLYGKRQF